MVKTFEIPEMIPLREAARRTGLSYDMLRKGCLNHRFAHVQAGRKVLINYSALCRYLETAGTGDERCQS